MNEKKVLVIDVPLYSAALKNNLFRSGELFQVVDTAETFEQIEEKMRAHQIDVVLMDLNLIELDYHQLLEFLNEEYPSLVKVGFSEESFRSKALELELEHFFPKPDNVFELHPWSGSGINLMDCIHQQFHLERTVKVMIVDDAALMVAVLNKLIETDPALEVVAKAPNGQEALEHLKSQRPDVILLDIEMPVMDGLTFLRHARIKSQAKIVILSSVATIGSPKAAEARRLGADAVITKPSGAVSFNLKEKAGNKILDTIYEVLRS